jgi:hypothetical protein
MDLKNIDFEVGGEQNQYRSCPQSGFGIGGVEPTCSATAVLVR